MKKKKKSNDSKNQNSMLKLFLILFFICVTVIINNMNNNPIQKNKTNLSKTVEKQQTQEIKKIEQENYNQTAIVPNRVEENSTMKVHYIDVGQGDAIFIELPNKQTMLIDAGELPAGIIVEKYIKDLGYDTLDYVIGTHPHTDHIGGLEHMIKVFKTNTIYMPKAISTSKTYESLLTTILEQNKKVITAKAGVSILDIPNLKIEIIAPNQDNYTDLNNFSAVIKITYNMKVFLFMGDAEIPSEKELLNDIQADVIKVGHHGSDTSSSQAFVNKVSPEYAIIMVGKNNQYKHPNKKIVDRWISSGATVYQTDKSGNIIITTNGTNLEIHTSK